MGRRSPFGRLKLAKYDPAVGLAIDPIVDWAKACWDDLVPESALQDAWRMASVRVGLSGTPFQEVQGPAGGVIASALRIGWAVPGPRTFLTRRKELLDLEVVCPALVHQFAGRDFEQVQAEASAMAKGLGFTPNLDPLAEVVGSRPPL
jgi:hypothetical protein